ESVLEGRETPFIEAIRPPYYQERYGRGDRLEDHFRRRHGSRPGGPNTNGTSTPGNSTESSAPIDALESSEAFKFAKESFDKADEVYVVLSTGMLGDGIVGTGYLSAIREQLNSTGRNIPITVVVRPEFLELYKVLESGNV